MKEARARGEKALAARRGTYQLSELVHSCALLGVDGFTEVSAATFKQQWVDGFTEVSAATFKQQSRCFHVRLRAHFTPCCSTETTVKHKSLI